RLPLRQAPVADRSQRLGLARRSAPGERHRRFTLSRNNRRAGAEERQTPTRRPKKTSDAQANKDSLRAETKTKLARANEDNLRSGKNKTRRYATPVTSPP